MLPPVRHGNDPEIGHSSGLYLQLVARGSSDPAKCLCSVAPREKHMTERKPPEISWETWIETQIRIAMEEGPFDNLPGAGKPLPSFGQEFDPLWWQKQLVRREQVSILPPSLELLRKVEAALAAIGVREDEAAVRHQVAVLNVEITKINPTAVE